MPTQIDLKKQKIFNFQGDSYTADELQRYLEEGESFVNELAEELLQEGQDAMKQDIEEFIDKVFRNSSMRGSQVRNLTSGRVGPNRRRVAGSNGPYPSIDRPMRIDRLHGADENGLTSDVYVQESSDGTVSIVVTNYVFNLLDQGREAITSETPMTFPVYEGRRLQVGSLSLSAGRTRIVSGIGRPVIWVRTRQVDRIPAHGFLEQIVENRRLKGSAWNRQMRRYQLRASKRVEDYPIELSFRFDDTLLSVEVRAD